MSQWLQVAEIAKRVQQGSVRARDLVEQSLKTIAEQADYRAIIATLEPAALKRAQDIDTQLAAGKSVGALAGVPFIAKDNYLVFGAETTAGSNILKGFTAPYQATVIQRLEAAGAICVAKANLDAFGHGASTENSDFFTTKNPHDLTRVSGGSSGGSAVAVVLDMVPFALGTDTGGSSRQPASFTGCVGYKPTYGLMSRSGIVAMASSTDTVGVLARNVTDVATVVDVMAGVDPLDSTTIARDPQPYAIAERHSLAGVRVGVIKEYMSEGVSAGVLTQIRHAVEAMANAGAVVREISLPTLPFSLAAYYIIVPAEISSNLSRYDGQRYGYRYDAAGNLDESYNKSRSIGFGKEAKRRIMIGTHVLSSGYYDAYYKRAQTVRTKLIREFDAAFRDVDVLVGPTAPTTAFKIGENVHDPLQMYLSDVMTVGVSLVGAPAIVVPAGMANDLPVGLQIIAPQRQDRALFAVARAVEELLNGGLTNGGLPNND